MEACIANLVEPGDKVLVGNKGIWGERVAEMARRFRADVTELKVPAGQTLAFADLKKALLEQKPTVLFLCQVCGMGRGQGVGASGACVAPVPVTWRAGSRQARFCARLAHAPRGGQA